MTYQPGTWRPVKELLHRFAPYQSESAAAKLILRELSDIIAGKGSESHLMSLLVTSCHLKSREVTRSHAKSPKNRIPNTPPTPARARTPEEKYINTPSSLSEEQPADVAELTIRLSAILNSVPGVEARPHDPNSQRAVYVRLRGTDGADAATPEEMEELVTHCCKTWPGTKWAKGLRLTTLLGIKFWDYRSTMGVKTEGRQEGPQAPTVSDIMRREARKRAEEQRLADESAARHRAEMAAAEPEPGTAELMNRYAKFIPDSAKEGR
jgi:hypothetical protein